MLIIADIERAVHSFHVLGVVKNDLKFTITVAGLTNCVLRVAGDLGAIDEIHLSQEK